jgi:hypothetical protein
MIMILILNNKWEYNSINLNIKININKLINKFKSKIIYKTNKLIIYK